MGKFGGKLLASAILFWTLATGSSCQHPQVPKEDKSPVPSFDTIAFIGFRPGLSSSQEPGLVRSTISGAVFSAEPVSEAVAETLSASLFSLLTQRNGQNWLPPRETAAAFTALASSNPTLTDRDIYVRIGQVLSAQGVLGGHVYRWREREGTDFAASRPASVAFDLYLMSAGDGAVLWKARFDKTQISLSENLFDLQTFLKARGRWMTAGELADLGLAEIVETFPREEKERK